MSQVTISNKTLPLVEYLGKRVVTFSMVDHVHARALGNAKNQFNRNKHHMTEGEDFYLVDFAERYHFDTFGVEVPPRGLTVLTESGYLMLVKSFTDDLAWEVQRQLVTSYFKKEVAFTLPDFTNPIVAARAWADEVEAKMRLEEKVKEDAPKIAFAETVANSEGCHDMAATAKILGTGRNTLFKRLRESKILAKNNLPLQAYIKTGYFRVIEHPITIAGVQRLYAKTLVTAKGLAFIQRSLTH